MSDEILSFYLKVIVSTIGKVGSSTLKSSLNAAGFKQFNSSPSDIHKLINHVADCSVNTHDIKYTAYVVSQIAKRQENCLIFVGARDLLRRHISAFFQNLQNKDNKYWYLPDWKNITIAQLHHEFENRAIVHIEELAANWFYRFTRANELPDNEVSHTLEQTHVNGISSLDLPGRNGSKIKYVFYQLEKLNANWQLIKDYSNISRLPNEPLSTNKASTKPISETYTHFLRSYTPSSRILEMSYNCDLCNFYAREEIDRQKQNWYNKKD